MWINNFIEILRGEGYSFHTSLDDNRLKPINLKYKIKNVKDVKELVKKIRSKVNKIILDEKIAIVLPIEKKGEIIYQSLLPFLVKKLK